MLLLLYVNSPAVSAEVANGMQAKNTSMQMENEQKKIKIAELSKEIETIKFKQAGITRN